MNNVTIKNIPDELYEKIKTVAQYNQKNICDEIITQLEQSLKSKRIDVDSLIEGIEKLHGQIKTVPLTDEFLQAAKVKGRA